MHIESYSKVMLVDGVFAPSFFGFYMVGAKNSIDSILALIRQGGMFNVFDGNGFKHVFMGQDMRARTLVIDGGTLVWTESSDYVAFLNRPNLEPAIYQLILENACFPKKAKEDIDVGVPFMYEWTRPLVEHGIQSGDWVERHMGNNGILDFIKITTDWDKIGAAIQKSVKEGVLTWEH